MNINLPLDPRLRPPDGTRQPPPPSHPSEGGKAYSDDLRRQVLQMHFNNYNLREAPKWLLYGRKGNSHPFNMRPLDPNFQSDW